MNVQSPLSREGENARGPDGTFTATEENTSSEQIKRSSTPVLEETILNTIIDLELIPANTGFGRGRKKLIRKRTTMTLEEQNFMLYV